MLTGFVIIMTGKRSRLEMCLNVLEKINQGVSKPTNIMYKCNLSWRPLQEILRLLTEKGLIEEIKSYDRKYYVATEKGKEILIYLRRVIQMLRPVGGEKTEMSSRKPEFLMTIQGDFNSLSIYHQRKQQKKE